jgi:hypothetical protein
MPPESSEDRGKPNFRERHTVPEKPFLGWAPVLEADAEPLWIRYNNTNLLDNNII